MQLAQKREGRSARKTQDRTDVQQDGHSAARKSAKQREAVQCGQPHRTNEQSAVAGTDVQQKHRGSWQRGKSAT